MKHALKNNLILTFLLSFACLPSSAQDSPLRAGLRLGGGVSSNSNVDRILVSEDFYSNYSFKKRLHFVPCAELFLLYRKPASVWGLEVGVAYYNRTAGVHYDDRDELNYTLSARYHHLGLAAHFNVYPFRGRNTFHV